MDTFYKDFYSSSRNFISFFFQKRHLNKLKQNIFSKTVDVNEHLKFPYEDFHSWKRCSKF